MESTDMTWEEVPQRRYANCLGYSTGNQYDNNKGKADFIRDLLMAKDNTKWPHSRMDTDEDLKDKITERIQDGSLIKEVTDYLRGQTTKQGRCINWMSCKPDQLATYFDPNRQLIGVGFNSRDGIHFYKVNDDQGNGKSIAGRKDGELGRVYSCTRNGSMITQKSSTGSSTYFLLGFLYPGA